MSAKREELFVRRAVRRDVVFASEMISPERADPFVGPGGNFQVGDFRMGGEFYSREEFLREYMPFGEFVAEARAKGSAEALTPTAEGAK